MTTRTPTRWGIAATGRMAAVFAEDLALVPEAELAFVGSRSADSAAAFAERVCASGSGSVGSGSVGSGTYRDLLDSDVDVVYIATPHPQHRDLALAAIEAGKHVLVEKAFTATVAGAEEVVAAARAAGVFCMEAMWTRFVPAVARLRELVAAGEIGDVTTVQADFCGHRAFDPDSRLFDLALGGGAVLDLGVYPISFAQHLLGAPDRVTATGTHYPNGADASAGILLSYDDGGAASLMCSLTAATPGRAVVVGTGGSIELEPPFHHTQRLVVRRNGAEPETLDAPTTGVGYTHQVDEVHRCLAAGLTESPVLPLDDTLAVQRVLGECLDQLGVTIVEGTVEI